MVNVHAFRYTDYCEFLTLTSENRASRQKVRKFFADSPRTAWLAELSGEFHYSVSIFARDVFEVELYFRALTAAVPGVVVEKSLALRISWTTFRWKYLSNHRSMLDYITRSRADTTEKIESIDHEVLRAISEHPLAPRAHQARAAGIPVTSFHNRVGGGYRHEVCSALRSISWTCRSWAFTACELSCRLTQVRRSSHKPFGTPRTKFRARPAVCRHRPSLRPLA
jgi:hypothetical protein